MRPSIPVRPLLLVEIVALGALSACAPTFLQRAAVEPGAVRLPSGSVMRTLQPGDGPVPAPASTVTVSWEGRLVNGKVFASSADQSGASVLALDGASRCFREAIERMHVGEKARVVCVSAMAKSDLANVPPDTTVDFQIELVGLGAVEPDVKLPEGMVFRSLQPAGNTDRPRASDRVKVNYEGRLADGTVFDSSIKQGAPVVFALSSVIPCWRYGLQKMHVGEKAELVCPPDVAYGVNGSPPSIPPNATLTFEVELLAIER